MNEDDPRLIYIPFDKIITEAPSGVVKHYKDSYWITHPDKGIAIYKTNSKFSSPQCNVDKNIVEILREKIYPWAEIKLFPSVFLPFVHADH